jgi:hypothetical protein
VTRSEASALNAKELQRDLKVFRKQTLESLIPGTLGPSSPTKLEKNQKRFGPSEKGFGQQPVKI